MVFAQWSSDPLENTTIYPGYETRYSISDRYGMARLKDGSTYFVWSNKNNERCLQLYNQDGYPAWESNLVLPFEYHSISLNLVIDNKDNAIIAATENYPEDQQIIYHSDVITKITPEGEFYWHDTLKRVKFIGQPHGDNYTYISSDDNILLIYNNLYRSDSNKYVANKRLHWISEDGVIPHGSEGIDLEETDFAFPQLLETGACMVFYGDFIGTHHDSFTYNLKIRKIDIYGNPSWDKDPILYSGFIPPWTMNFWIDQFEDIYFTWRGNFVRKVTKNGSLSWQDDSHILIYDDQSWSYSSHVVGENAKGEIYYFLKRGRGYERDPALYAQLIDSEGNRLLGDKGKKVLEDGLYGISYLSSAFVNDTIFFICHQSEQGSNLQPNNFKLFACDFEGNLLWDEPKVIGSEQTISSTPRFSKFINGEAVLFWRDDFGDHKYILKAQNIHSDGTFGIKTSSKKEIPMRPELFKGYDPTNKILRFDNSERGGNFCMYNSSGLVIASGKIKSEVSLPNLPSGIYILNILAEVDIESHKLFVR